VRFRPNGPWLLTVAEDGSVRMYDIPTARLLRRITPSGDDGGAPTYTSCATLHAAGAAAGAPVLLTGGTDGAIAVWECR